MQGQRVGDLTNSCPGRIETVTQTHLIPTGHGGRSCGCRVLHDGRRKSKDEREKDREREGKRTANLEKQERNEENGIREREKFGNLFTCKKQTSIKGIDQFDFKSINQLINRSMRIDLSTIFRQSSNDVESKCRCGNDSSRARRTLTFLFPAKTGRQKSKQTGKSAVC